MLRRVMRQAVSLSDTPQRLPDVVSGRMLHAPLAQSNLQAARLFAVVVGGCARGSAALPHGAQRARGGRSPGAGRALSGNGREIAATRAAGMTTRRTARRKTSRMKSRMKSSMTGTTMARTDDEDDWRWPCRGRGGNGTMAMAMAARAMAMTTATMLTMGMTAMAADGGNADGARWFRRRRQRWRRR